MKDDDYRYYSLNNLIIILKKEEEYLNYLLDNVLDDNETLKQIRKVEDIKIKIGIRKKQLRFNKVI